MRIHFYLHGSLTHEEILLKLMEKLMATLDDILALVSDEDTKLDSVIALIDGLKKQLDDVLAGTTLPPAVQAKVDALFDKATTNAAKIVDALDTNVPPTPVP